VVEVTITVKNNGIDTSGNGALGNGFAEAVAHDTVLVSNNDDGSKGERSTTLGNLGNAIDSDESVLELDFARLDSFDVYFCHDLLEF
jgi:hypothetical protein